METELCLLLAIKMCTGFTTDVVWVNTKVYSVTNEPTRAVAEPFHPLQTHQRY